MNVARVLIAGGGIAGLTLRRALGADHGRVDLVERSGLPVGAGLAIQPNAVRALRSLGVSAAVERAGTTVHRFEYRDQAGDLLCGIDLDELWGDVGPFVGITRSALHTALLDGIPAEARPVERVLVRDGRATAAFEDGTVATYDLVVGADGINSRVGGTAVGSAAPAYSGQLVWRGLARVPAGDAVQFWLGQDRFFGLCPAGDGLAYGFGNLVSDRRRDPVDGRKDRLTSLFADFAAPVREFLAATGSDDDLHCAPIEWLPEVAWGKGPVLLIGDAAHAMSPMMGQGGCMAIEDAVVLADELRRAADLPSALASFTARRGPRVDWVREQSRLLSDLVRIPVELRNSALRANGTAGFYDRYRPLIAAP